MSILIQTLMLNLKIDVFVYRSNNDNIGNRLSFANPPLLTIHTQFKHTKGHELAHLFVNNIYEGVNSKNRFIDEGFAEYFNEQQIYDETKIHDVHLQLLSSFLHWDFLYIELPAHYFLWLIPAFLLWDFLYIKWGLKNLNCL